VTEAEESTQSELVMIRQQLAETRGPLCTCQKRKTGKRIFLKDKYVFSTEEVLEIAKEAEMKTAANKIRRKRKPSPIMVEMTQTRPVMSESDVSHSGPDCVVVASSRQL